MDNILTFAGLGNPGSRYEDTRHNMGFLFCDFIQKKFDFPPFSYRKKFLGFTTRKERKGKTIYLLKPDTYMNRSGDSIGRFFNYFSIPVQQLFVVMDDMDFPFGTIKIRKSGGAGSHNGMRSVIGSIPESDFCRIRLGIGSPPENIPGRSFVLSRLTSDEKKEIVSKHQPIWKDIFAEITENGVDLAMNKFNRRGND